MKNKKLLIERRYIIESNQDEDGTIVILKKMIWYPGYMVVRYGVPASISYKGLSILAAYISYYRAIKEKQYER